MTLLVGGRNGIRPVKTEQWDAGVVICLEQSADLHIAQLVPLEAAQNEVTPEDLWKGTKTVLLEVARETIGSIKSQKKKKWTSDATYAAIREKREAKAKTRNDIKN